MNRAANRLIWMAMEQSAEPWNGGGVLEVEMRATDMRAGETYGGIHLVANPAKDRSHTQPSTQIWSRHHGDGLIEECAESPLAFGGGGIIQVADWVRTQSGQGRLHPIGRGLRNIIHVLGQYSAGSTRLLGMEGMDLGTLMECISSVNPELASDILQGASDSGTRTGTNLDSQITVYRRIMSIIEEIA